MSKHFMQVDTGCPIQVKLSDYIKTLWLVACFLQATNHNGLMYSLGFAPWDTKCESRLTEVCVID